MNSYSIFIEADLSCGRGFSVFPDTSPPEHCLENKNNACCDKPFICPGQSCINLYHQSNWYFFIWKVHVYCLYSSGLWQIEPCLVLGVWVIPPTSVGWLMTLRLGGYVGKVFAMLVLPAFFIRTYTLLIHCSIQASIIKIDY